MQAHPQSIKKIKLSHNGSSEFVTIDNYKGQVRHGVPHGIGAKKVHNDIHYFGEFKDGEMKGVGCFTFNKIVHVKGDCEDWTPLTELRGVNALSELLPDSLAKGFYIIVNQPTGKIYELYKFDDVQFGQLYVSPKHRYYTGEILNLMPHGFGTWTNIDESYRGQMSEGKKHGLGKRIMNKTGERTFGLWKADVLDAIITQENPLATNPKYYYLKVIYLRQILLKKIWLC